MRIRPAKIALAGFVVLLIALVLLADSGRGDWLFRFAGIIPEGDKVGHVLLFGILSFLCNLLAQCRTVQWFGVRLLKWNLILMLVVSLEECSQLLFRSRTFDLFDLLSDALGIWIFGRLARLHLSRKRQLANVATARPD